MSRRRFSQSLAPGLALIMALLGCAPAPGPKDAKALPPLVLRTPEEELAVGNVAYAASEYERAEAAFRAAARGPTEARASFGLAQVFAITGRDAEAVQSARAARAKDPKLLEATSCLAAEALRSQGKLSEARAEVLPASAVDGARRAKLLLAELELDSGRRKQAEPLLLSLIEDYNEDRIAESDGEGLSLAARAAWLLRSPKDANTLFNAAEHAKSTDPRLLLWRAELFLDRYDPAHAEELVREVLEKAPNHPQALMLLARVRLDQALDFDEAERLALLALRVNPSLAAGYFVLSGIALRDMELEAADAFIVRGLKAAPADLTLLSLRAVVRFLDADEPGFLRQKQLVFAQNPEYSRFYAILGEYADWEHRYDEIVRLMREALTIDREDAGALAQLGLNLIRAGQETEGVSSLSRAFALDPYNVRVYNTLELYDSLIPKAYVSTRSDKFMIRYHKQDQPILSRYVPALLEKAFAALREGYGFSPETPIGVELYAERESFAVRTSGLPQTAIQGVCFGRTLAAMSPQHESFNLGMTLWHELSHVFHIQLSKARVPRWFTEGLAEYETLITRPEWSRHHDQELFEMMRAKKLPPIGRMSRAFTRAEAISDVATAYYASSKIVEMLAGRVGRAKMAEMLRLWGEGRRAEQVFQTALGKDTAAVDREFQQGLSKVFARYEKEFVPLSRARSLDALQAALGAAPDDPALLVELAFTLLRAGEEEPAGAAITRALARDPKHADARFLASRLASSKDDDKRADELLRGLVKDGFDGYAVQMALGDLARKRGDTASARAAFELATRSDPSEAEPLLALADIAAAEKVPSDELAKLERLAPLAPHQPSIQRRLVRRLLEAGRDADAVKAGEAALWADVNGLETHLLFAEALSKTHDDERARFELESALLCAGDPPSLADVHARLAELHLKNGRKSEAKRAARETKRLDPNNARLRALKF